MRQNVSNTELMRYGVLGTKLGIRRNASKTFGRATMKAKKLESKEDEARRKAVSAEHKATKWKKGMFKAFKDVKVDSINKDTLSNGKTYVDMLAK